jgi:glycosyltransferase involved in cell wall biosynthesis
MGCKISFVITTRDESPATLEATLEGLLTTSARYGREVLVVDDGSITPVVCPANADVDLVRHDVPMGVSQSRRHGASMTTGEVLVWLDPHMTFAADWLDRMMAHVESRELLCATWWNYELTRPLCWGANIAWCGERDYRIRRCCPGFTYRHITNRPQQDALDVGMVIGACYMMVRESYEQVGGFSPLVRIWGSSDMDFSIRCWMAGKGVKCITEARVGHPVKSKFQYPVSWAHVEFNKLAMIRTIFDPPTVRALEASFHPLPAEVKSWLAEDNVSEWRSFVQPRRKIGDGKFFRTFVSNLPQGLTD